MDALFWWLNNIYKIQESVDPFSLVADELSLVANRLRSMMVAEVPKLALAAEYFFKMGVEGKRFSPTVASLLHDDVLDDAGTRCGNPQVVTLLVTVVEHLVTGETMQMTTSAEKHCSMEYYLQKTYYKTASLISNSCKAIALLAGQTAEGSKLAYNYGRNLGLAYQLIDDVLDFTRTSATLGKGSLSDIRHGIVTAPMLFAIEEFPQLQAIVHEGFDDPANVDVALDYVGKSRGIERTRELAAEHAHRAVEAIEALPKSDDEDVRISRRALLDLTQRVLTRTK
ncbi:hypothetical protein QJS10_CPA01g00520 [Acorus calamus]|uniref:Geranyl diphosphate synthase n=1 Tax=Acorus calamus TaxID=4465 RepID=A0AAV9FRP6_ACOCL|nr:hypothetical protein QJS10_CPA01g00520 [Acorus calamus]